MEEYYKTLGLTEGATLREIEKAFQRMALEMHPDKHPNANTEEKFFYVAKFRELTESRDKLITKLSEPQKNCEINIIGKKKHSESTKKVSYILNKSHYNGSGIIKSPKISYKLPCLTKK
jgi:DnaJ-class molecular chaperone